MTSKAGDDLMKHFIITTFLLLSTIINAQEKKSPKDKAQSNFLYTYEEYQQLNPSQKNSYIKALQDFMVRGDWGNIPELQFSLINLFIEKAYALQEGKPCIFAGHMTELIILIPYQNRLVCKKPDKGSCKGEKEIECNPLLFGDNICVGPPFKNATGDCLKKSTTFLGQKSNQKNFDGVVVKKRYEDFLIKIYKYCEKPLSFNETNCTDLKVQIDLINKEYRKSLTKPFPAVR